MGAPPMIAIVACERRRNSWLDPSQASHLLIAGGLQRAGCRDQARCSPVALAIGKSSSRADGWYRDGSVRRRSLALPLVHACEQDQQQPHAAFSFLSGNGADPTRRSRMAFARYKGEAENSLRAPRFPLVYILRPAYIYPVEPRKEPNFTYRLLRVIYPVFRVLFANQVMVDVAVRQTPERGGLVFENRDIRAMAASPDTAR
jgi:hypothetical protein